MKKLMMMAVLAIGLSGTATLSAQSQGPNFAKMDVSPMDIALYRNDNNEPIARVIYSRPQRRDREVFGKLVPYGEVWRTGANEATEVTFYKDVMIAGAKIDAGTYTLYSIPEEKEWTIILNKKTLTWGAYEYSSEMDLARINVPVRQMQNSVDALSISFEKDEDTKGANLLIGWDKSYVKVPMKVAK
ncbi:MULTISPECIES: DUF2911 domain-containing protein [unclassified Zunongwangia]|uniref:DUF2911 domain-containing protein n=1 Tax=unclassified Zunongwangia TaxID=2632541 RepID=UPI0022DE1123|nr:MULTISPECIES: DUF2911 domain-containing protein [unclassified Zunongwangia]WBL21791.1 DUF2911 domain-containing protein [Zunongwangia sp. HRR-M8]WBL26260.1 DUF2911 domain-containing protein [Zunongwangia sp. HGR-M22]